MTDPRTALVAAGYDTMIDTWEAWKAQITDDSRADWCDELVSRLPRGARVVELGCGGGTDETRMLAERFRLTGVDLSAEQLRRARERVPGAAFVHARHHGARARAGLGRRGGRVLRLEPRPAGAASGPVRSRAPLAATRRSLPRPRSAPAISPAGRASGSGSRPTSRDSRPRRTGGCSRTPGSSCSATSSSRSRSPRARRRSTGCWRRDDLRLHAGPLPRAPARSAEWRLPVRTLRRAAAARRPSPPP